MLATKSLPTKELNYKELQTKLHELRGKGVALQVKLTSKRDVLLAEYTRLTEEQGTQVYTTDELPAMNPERAPSFLCKTHTVYWIDNGCGYQQEWLPWELELWLVQHEGAGCDLEVMKELETLTLSSSTSWDAPLSPQVSFGRGEERMAVEALTLQALEADTIENGSMDEQEEETLRPSVAEPQFLEVAAKDLDNVPALYIAIALPIWFMVCIAMPASRVVFRALLRAVERHISRLGTTEQLAWNNLRALLTRDEDALQKRLAAS